tara:strand:+ start:232 stop:972 length:741 start_codon:yes stop_codon:yes gene_type:complete
MALPKIDVPTYETKLISNGKIVRYRPFLVKEQKLFLMAAQSTDEKETIDVVKQVLNNCILSDIDVDDLPTFDLEHLFMQLRARSVGEVVNLKYNCNNTVKDDNGEDKTCGGLVKFDLNILDIKPTIDGKHSSKIEISDKLGIMMKYPTLSLIKDAGDLINEDVDTVLNVIVNCIDYIYDAEQMYYAKDSTKEELLEFIENLQQEDMEKIQLFFSTMPKIAKELDFKCKKCGYEETITVQGIQNFFV